MVSIWTSISKIYFVRKFKLLPGHTHTHTHGRPTSLHDHCSGR